MYLKDNYEDKEKSDNNKKYKKNTKNKIRNLVYWNLLSGY